MEERFSEITRATAELAALEHEEEAEIEAVRGKFRSRKDAAVARIELAATKIAIAARPAARASDGGSGQIKLVVHEPPEAPIPHIPPRRMKLLGLLEDAPDGDLGYFAKAVYGRDDKGARGGVSAEFSGLKQDGLVDPIEGKQGMFRLTSLARRALAAKDAAE